MTARAEKHTVFLTLDTDLITGYELESYVVHIWYNDGQKDVSFTDWAANEPLSPTGKYYEEPGTGNRYPVYAYSFDWTRTPDKIIFHTGAIQTADLPYTENALYRLYKKETSAQGNKTIVRCVTLGDISGMPTADMLSQTFYFANTADWQEVRVHGWNTTDTDNYPTRAWDNAPVAEDTGKYVRLGDMFYPCLSYTFITTWPVTGLKWYTKTIPAYSGDFTEVEDGQLFWNSSTNTVGYDGPVELVTEIPSEPGMIYFHTGANEVLSPGQWEQACAHLYVKGEPEPTIEELIRLAESEKMTRLEEGMWKIEVDDIHKYNDVGFYFVRYSAAQGEYIIDHVYRASLSAYYDPGTWARYVYDIGTQEAFQSYMTPAQYDEMTANPPESVYVIGNRPLGFADDNWDIRSIERLTADNGVFVRRLTAGALTEPAMFKLSRVDVNKYIELAGAGPRYENQRGWATFNLYLIGAETRGHDWIKIGQPYGRTNKAVFTMLNNSMPYNKFNQFEWCVSTNTSHYPDADPIIPGNSYYLVIDTHADDRSVSLLSFDPMPSVELSETRPFAVEIGYDKAAQLHDGLDMKAAHNGATYFDRVNVMVGNVKIQGVGETELERNHYTVLYTVMADGEPFFEMDDEGDENGTEVPYLPVSSTMEFNVRARYTNINTGVSFCSRTGEGRSDAPEFMAPEITGPVTEAYVNRRPGVTAPEGMFMMGVKATYGYSVPTALVHYADYELIAEPAGNGGAVYSPSADWTPWPGEGDYTDSHNWAKAIATNGSMPLDHPATGLVDFATLESDFSLHLTAHAVYPFLVRETNVSGRHAVARRRVSNASELTVPDDLSGFHIDTAVRSAGHNFSLSNAALTGVAYVAAADSDAPARYFNLQGVEMPADRLVPGVYLVVKGSRTSKTVVR